MAEPANHADTHIDIRPLGPVIGAEIHNVDLSRPLTDPQVAALRQAWLEVLFFRDQDLTLEQNIEFGKCFGELHIHPNVPAHPEHPEVLVIRADENSKRVAGHGWHTDVSCDLNPPAGNILRAERLSVLAQPVHAHVDQPRH
jgi:taurine dioxygenase